MGKGTSTVTKPVKEKAGPKQVEKKQEDTAPMEVDDADIDPLEAYMMDVTAEARRVNEEDKKRMEEMQKTTETRMDEDEVEPAEEEVAKDEEYGSDPEDILALAAKKARKKDLSVVDHSQIDYEPFRKDFYIEPPELRDLTSDQVDILRIELDGIKIRGVNCPKPIKKWTHCGLPAGCLEVIRRLKFDRPTSIQAQAIPAIMSGRDVIGVAKTGSGKTIAFLLPMFRHIKDQRPLEAGEGPIGVIMTPTRELATQIHRECKPFLKVLGLRAVCAYGGSPIKDQIADLKRGCEIIVCTPGRMIDLLCANSGRVTNLRRVTYLVLDEADRMFDMGFEPQVMKIVNNVRPTKQTVLFSATFPRQMEALARKVLKKPLEITVGGRSVVCSDVEQHVEVREDSTKFVRLLEILGKFFNDYEEEDARALIFVDRHEAADNLLRDLIRRGYPCQSLHGGKDQSDRDSTIADFKSGISNILIATSVAARGLDVKQLKLVVNYECPNHMEDYVHRVGRTGRAGNKGTAYTFITPDQDRYATDICKALKLSGQEVPADLQGLADQFQEKVKSGKERMASSGFGGKGLERLDKDRDLVKRIQKKAYGGEDMEESDEEFQLETRVVSGNAPASAASGIGGALAPGGAAATVIPGALAASTKDIAADAGISKDDPASVAAAAAKKAAAEVAARINAMVNSSKASSNIAANEEKKDGGNPVYAEEIIINDYPQNARWRVTNKEQISQITEVSGAAITTRGTFFPPGKQPGPGERKLYLFIEGDSELVVEKAKNEIKRILVEATVAQMEAEARTGGGGSGRYSVV
ncbi:P-loop containing nucleoside triphosphate hydrolase protein [Dichotomocladium elegans]|nr:P-loop containing nucleoside triphosphate hydrolase protein [Dichotomocladium elegans]